MARNWKPAELKRSQLETCVIKGIAFENPRNERAGKWTPADFMGSHSAKIKGRQMETGGIKWLAIGNMWD